MVDPYVLLTWISALAVIIPGLALLSLVRGVKIASLRNVTVILASFGILHGFYHLSYLIPPVGNYASVIDLASILLLVYLGVYYGQKVLALPLLLLALPDLASDLVPIALIFALILFVRLALKSRTLSSLQTQLSIFLIIWIVSELLRAFIVIGIISENPSLDLLGFEIHTASMVAFGLFLLFRFYVVTSRMTDSIMPAKQPAEQLAKQTNSLEKGGVK